MRKFLFIGILIFALILGGCLGTQPQGPKKIVGYFINWGIYGRNYQVTDIPIDKVTHILYAFAKIKNGKLTLSDAWADVHGWYNDAAETDLYVPDPIAGCFGAFNDLKTTHPNFKLLMSVGGWTLSSGFSTAAATDEGRKTFAASCIAFLRQFTMFDGIDLDWEYPVSGGIATDQSPDDKHNYTLLLQELRSELNAAGTADNKTYLLTVAAPAGVENIANLELSNMSQYVDWFNVMTYDYYVSTATYTNHLAGLYPNPADPDDNVAPDYKKTKNNVSATINTYLGGGVPSQKIVMGIPFYGRGWDGVAEGTTHGLFQTNSGASSVGTYENGVFEYNDLAANYIAADNSNVYWDDVAKASYLYDAANQRMISFESTQSLPIKMDYVISKKLGGAMFWELSCDKNATLIDIIYNKLH